MAAKGTKANPQYVTEDGTELELRAIKPLLLRRWQIDYKKSYPVPVAPIIILENGDEWRNANDAWYKTCLAEWDERQQDAFTEFLFDRGVKTKPPAGWEPILPDENAPPRYVWLSEILNDKDIAGLVEAIVGVDNETPNGIEDAEKNLTPDGEADP